MRMYLTGSSHAEKERDQNQWPVQRSPTLYPSKWNHIPSPVKPLRASLARLCDVEKLRQPLDDNVYVHVDERHLVVGALLHDGHEGQAVVDLAEHDGLLVVGQDDAALVPVAGDLVLELLTALVGLELGHVVDRPPPRPINLDNVDDDVDVVGAYLVRGHIGRGVVGGDVDLGENVEEVGFFKPAGAAERREHDFELTEPWDQFLDDLAKGLKDAVVIDGRQVEPNRGVLKTLVRQLVLDANRDVALDVEPVVIREAVDLVDEDLYVDVWVMTLEIYNCLVKPRYGLHVVVLCVDNPDESSYLSEDGIHIKIRAVEVVDLSGKIPYLEVHKRSDSAR